VKILITGRGTSGSWKIRGEQLGQAMGVEVCANASRIDADLVVLVKRPTTEILRAARGVPLVWDIVDAWPQPAGNDWGRGDCRRWLADQVRVIKPAAIVAATQKMAEDCECFGVPVLWLPHHHRPGIARNPIRERIEVVGYEGSEQYIAPHREAIEAQCKRIGARFSVNPPSLAGLDVVLALRGSRGYAARSWKSGVKLANAHGSGTPFIGCREAGYTETASGAEYWADTPAELGVALDWLRDQSAREQVADRFLQAARPVDRIAEQYREWLCALRF